MLEPGHSNGGTLVGSPGPVPLLACLVSLGPGHFERLLGLHYAVDGLTEVAFRPRQAGLGFGLRVLGRRQLTLRIGQFPRRDTARLSPVRHDTAPIPRLADRGPPPGESLAESGLTILFFAFCP